MHQAVTMVSRGAATAAHLLETASAHDASAVDLCLAADEMRAVSFELQQQAREYAGLGEDFRDYAAQATRDADRAAREAACMTRLAAVVSDDVARWRVQAASVAHLEAQPSLPLMGLRAGASLKPALPHRQRDLWVRGRMAIPAGENRTAQG